MLNQIDDDEILVSVSLPPPFYISIYFHTDACASQPVLFAKESLRRRTEGKILSRIHVDSVWALRIQLSMKHSCVRHKQPSESSMYSHGEASA